MSRWTEGPNSPAGPWWSIEGAGATEGGKRKKMRKKSILSGTFDFRVYRLAECMSPGVRIVSGEGCEGFTGDGEKDQPPQGAQSWELKPEARPWSVFQFPGLDGPLLSSQLCGSLSESPVSPVQGGHTEGPPVPSPGSCLSASCR